MHLFSPLLITVTTIPPVAYYPSKDVATILSRSRSRSLNFTTRCFDSHWWCNIGKRVRLSQPSWLSVSHYNVVILMSTYLLNVGEHWRTCGSCRLGCRPPMREEYSWWRLISYSRSTTDDEDRSENWPLRNSAYTTTVTKWLRVQFATNQQLVDFTAVSTRLHSNSSLLPRKLVAPPTECLWSAVVL